MLLDEEPGVALRSRCASSSATGSPAGQASGAPVSCSSAARGTRISATKTARAQTVCAARRQIAHPKAIQERLGHSSITVTLDRYGHLFPKLDEALTDRLDDLHRAALNDDSASSPSAPARTLGH